MATIATTKSTSDTAKANFITDHGSIRLRCSRARRGPLLAVLVTVPRTALAASATRAAPTATEPTGRPTPTPVTGRTPAALTGCVAGGALAGATLAVPATAPDRADPTIDWAAANGDCPAGPAPEAPTAEIGGDTGFADTGTDARPAVGGAGLAGAAGAGAVVAPDDPLGGPATTGTGGLSGATAGGAGGLAEPDPPSALPVVDCAVPPVRVEPPSDPPALITVVEGSVGTVARPAAAPVVPFSSAAPFAAVAEESTFRCSAPVEVPVDPDFACVSVIDQSCSLGSGPVCRYPVNPVLQARRRCARSPPGSRHRAGPSA